MLIEEQNLYVYKTVVYLHLAIVFVWLQLQDSFAMSLATTSMIDVAQSPPIYAYPDFPVNYWPHAVCALRYISLYSQPSRLLRHCTLLELQLAI